jgi:CheY-like chemotaxis protein
LQKVSFASSLFKTASKWSDEVEEAAGQRILVAAADPLIRRLAGDGLVEKGFEVLNAASVRLAHAVLREPQGLHLVVVDLDMPGSGGISLANDARAIFPSIPVLFVTVREEEVDESRLEVVRSGFGFPYGVMSLGEAYSQFSKQYSSADGRFGHDGVGS